MPKRNPPKKSPTGNYGSGYCLPPKHGQIKPGEVRNPWGPKGKPKPEKFDPFEFAASQLTLVTINGKQMEIPAEAAAHLRNMSAAVSGDHRAHKNVQDERRSRRRAMPEKTAEEALQEAREDELKRILSDKLRASIGDHLNMMAELKRKGMIGSEGGWSKMARLAFVMIARGDVKDVGEETEEV